MVVDSDQYLEAIRDYEERWELVDETLLRLCRDHPAHARPDVVCAKLWIMGRTYATGIERKVATKGTQGSSLSQVAAHLLARGRELDALFRRLFTANGVLTKSKLNTILDVHGQVLGLLRPITRKGQTLRSFASKYMHFHNPNVPIYDSVAARVVPRVVRWTGSLQVIDPPLHSDPLYCTYAMRLLRLYEDVAERNLPVSMKYLDAYLLWLAGRPSSRVQEAA